jgi:hypothetical protein
MACYTPALACGGMSSLGRPGPRGWAGDLAALMFVIRTSLSSHRVWWRDGTSGLGELVCVGLS